MTNIPLFKPSSYQGSIIQCNHDSNFVFNFDPDDARFARHGDNLAIFFTDGSSILLKDFYVVFSQDNLPVFTINGNEVSGDELTAFLNENILSSAGTSTPIRSGSSGVSVVDIENYSVDDGYSRLAGLDGTNDPALQSTLQGDVAEQFSLFLRMLSGNVTPDPSNPGEDTTPVNYFEIMDDYYKGGILNSVTLNVLDNDNSGLYAADNVYPYSTICKYGTVDVTTTGDVTLNLDGQQMENAIFEGTGVDNVLTETVVNTVTLSVNNAGKVNIPSDDVVVTYTAHDASGTYSGSAKAIISVGDNNAVMAGGSSNDVAWVAGSSSTIDTDEGIDTIVAANNAGTIKAGGKDDKLYLGNNNGLVDGGDNNDMINISGTNAGQIQGGDGADTITVYKNAGKVHGGAGEDLLDIVEGVAGSSVYGGIGQDTLVLRGGAGYLDGGDDDDVLNVQGDNDMHRWSQNWSDPGKRVQSLDRAERNDTQYATLVGGTGNDTLTATDVSHHNTLYGDDTNTGSTIVVGDDTIQISDYAQITLHMVVVALIAFKSPVGRTITRY